MDLSSVLLHPEFLIHVILSLSAILAYIFRPVFFGSAERNVRMRSKECVCFTCQKILLCSHVANMSHLKKHACYTAAEASWNVMACAQKPDFIFLWNRRVHSNRPEASVQLTTGSRGVRISGSNAGYTMFWGSVKGTEFPLHFPSSASPCAITFQLESTTRHWVQSDVGCTSHHPATPHPPTII